MSRSASSTVGPLVLLAALVVAVLGSVSATRELPEKRAALRVGVFDRAGLLDPEPASLGEVAADAKVALIVEGPLWIAAGTAIELIDLSDAIAARRAVADVK